MKIRTKKVQGFEDCGLVEIELPDSVAIFRDRAFKSEEFRMMKVREKSRLTVIHRQFRKRPLRLL
jgi:hypothetical protein